jgi:hypothetical protein
VLVARLAAGDLDKARETYQQSLEMFTEMGADGYVQVLQQRLIALEEKKILPNTLA